MITISPTEDQLFDALKAFLTSILPPNVPVVRGQTNRVPEPAEDNWVEITPLFMPRLATNIDNYADCALTGSISGEILTVTVVQFGKIFVGAPLYGAVAGTAVTAMGSGTGGAGTYTVAPSQSLASGPLYAGVLQAKQAVQASVQIDVHGPAGADNTNIITTLFRDDYACQFFLGENIDAQPLYATDPRQIAFVNAEDQYEDRWTFEAVMQVNPTVQAPQQFADELHATTTEVEATYPVA